MNPTDTIAALASAPGPSLRAVVRVSGEDAKAATRGVFAPDDPAAWDDCRAATRFEGAVDLDGVPVPAVCLLWPTSRSYTGQPAAELHLPGGDVVSGHVLERLQAAGVRPAGRGEFTLRAFLAGRLDLAQAEAVLGVIDAEDSDELSDALTQLAGGASGPLAELHEALLIDLADLEAGLDFADEDLDFVSREAFAGRVAEARALIADLRRQTGERSASGAAETVVLVGPPNAGKSTLFNALVGRDDAIVSGEAGTTRDYLEAAVDFSGRSARLVDTAGEDDSAEFLAAAGESKRKERADAATLVLRCGVSPEDLPAAAGPREILVQTQRDRGGPVREDAVGVSAATGAGLDGLRAAVAAALDADGGGRSRLLATTAARCVGSLRRADAALAEAASLLDAAAGDELVAEELRAALDALAVVLGRVYTDDILDRVFSRFCIGK